MNPQHYPLSGAPGTPAQTGPRFLGRTVVVTGGTGALGSAVVARLVSEGATCHIPVHHEKELKRFTLKDHPQVKITPAIDLQDEASVARFYAGIEQPPLWASVHVAGGFAMSPLSETSAEAFTDQWRLNTLTCFLCCREAARCMGIGATGSSSGGGRIVNTAARPALEPRTGAQMAAYTASKAGVAALTQALGEELAPRGILVNAVVPSIMDTHANRAAMPSADFSRWASVEAVAATIAFLASPDNTSTRSGLIPVYGQS